jgi:copper transport protein
MHLMPAKFSQSLLLTAALLLATALFPVAASGHAELLYSKPKSGQVLDRSPSRFLLVFEEEIDLGLVQLEVRDGSGRSVARGEPFNPGGNGARVAVRLDRDLEGTIVASYRAISEDGHPVAKRTVFQVRAPKGEKGHAAPPPSAKPPGPSM